MLFKILFPFILSINGVYLLEEAVTDPTCQNLYTYGYGYRQFYNIPKSSLINGSIQFNFSLSSPSNGHVLLSEKSNSYPAYEIVIGAGGNGYSEIRKYKRNHLEPKTHLTTKNIISSYELRNFSISFKDSILSLHSMQNNKWYRILTWEDNSPLDIKYFSLCSWTGVSARWVFDCKGASPVSEKLTPLRRLRKNLLDNYDPYSVPATDINKLIVDASVDLQHLSLDAKKSLLTTHGKFYFTWFDARMQWDPKEYENITSITLLNRGIWLPDFILYNSQDQGTSPMEKAVIRILNNGTVKWSPEAKLVTWCSLDLKNWPFDEHSCNISLGLYSHPDYVHVSLSSENVKPELMLKDLEWKIISLIGETTTIINPWEFNTSSEEVPKAFSIKIRLKRLVQMHVYSFIMPTVACIVIILASFWLPIFVSKRLYLHIACLFLLLFNLISLETALPALPSSTPYLITVNCNLIILTVIHIISCAYIISKVEFFEGHVSKFVNRIVTHPIVHSIFCLFVNSQYNSMIEDTQLNEDNCPNTVNQWTLFGIILDRILSLVTIVYISVILIL